MTNELNQMIRKRDADENYPWNDTKCVRDIIYILEDFNQRLEKIEKNQEDNNDN